MTTTCSVPSPATCWAVSCSKPIPPFFLPNVPPARMIPKTSQRRRPQLNSRCGMSRKSVTSEAEDILLATDMVKLGARLQVLQSETSLSYDRLARLYLEIRKASPPKGMLPYSVDWFMTWLPNLHASLFYSHYCFLDQHTPSRGVRALIDAYPLYHALALAVRADRDGTEPVLCFLRAWMLLRFFDDGMLQPAACRQCRDKLLAHAYEPAIDFVCAICRPPPLAGKPRAAAKGRRN